jgi:hypothetical protein
VPAENPALSNASNSLIGPWDKGTIERKNPVAVSLERSGDLHASHMASARDYWARRLINRSRSSLE